MPEEPPKPEPGPDDPAATERHSADSMVPKVYDELRRIASARMSRLRPGQTLQATALVHDAYLRVAKPGHPGFTGRAHFLAAASRAMRELLIEQARRKSAIKHGGGLNRASTSQIAELGTDGPVEDVLALDEALRRLEAVDERKARVVHLRYFGGLTMEEIAEVVGVSLATVERDWLFARTWLHREIGKGDHDEA